MRAILGTAVLFLLIPCICSAGELPPGLHAAKVTWQGHASLNASFTGAVLLNGTLPDEGVDISIKKGHLEIDQSHIDIVAGGAGATPANNTRADVTLTAARVHSFILQPACRILVIPLTTSTSTYAELERGQLGPSDLGNKTYQPRTNLAHPDLHVAADTAVHLESDVSQATLNVTGPALVVVWGANFTIDQAGTSQIIRTGEERRPIEDGPVPTTVASSYQTREAYITIENGSLRLPVNASFRIFLKNPQVNVEEGSFVLQNPSGILPVDGSLIPRGSKNLAFAAPVHAIVGSGQNGLTISFVTIPDQADLDGTLVRSGGSNNPSAWRLAVFALVAAPLVAIGLSRAQLHRRLGRLDSLVKARRFGVVLPLAQTIRRYRPKQEEALVAQAISLVHLRRYKEASNVLEARGWTTQVEPLRNFLRAIAASGQGLQPEAIAALRHCMRDAPDMALDALANPLLEGLVKAAQNGRGGSSALPSST